MGKLPDYGWARGRPQTTASPITLILGVNARSSQQQTPTFTEREARASAPTGNCVTATTDFGGDGGGGVQTRVPRHPGRGCDQGGRRLAEDVLRALRRQGGLLPGRLRRCSRDSLQRHLGGFRVGGRRELGGPAANRI